MSILNEYNLKSSNCKHDIYVREWLPEGMPVGVIQICHGVAEHMGRYDEFAKRLADEGYVVSGNDHLGHGKSIKDDSDLGFFGENGGWELAVGDIRKLYERLKERYPRIPYFIFGHSMGSFLARTFIIRYHDGPDGVILSGTGQQASLIVAAGIALAKNEIRSKGVGHTSELVNKVAFGSYNRRIKNNRTEWDWLTSNQESLQNYIDDHLCGFVPTAGLFRDMFTGIKYISSPKNVRRVNKNLPIFLIAGTADPVGDYGKGVLRVHNGYMNAGLEDVTLKLYNGARHELIADFCKDEVFSDVLSWIRKKSEK